MITTVIIIITCVVSIAAFNNKQLFYNLSFYPIQMHDGKQPYRFVTHALLHADAFHLIINMFVLYSFGSAVEMYYRYYFNAKGTLYFLMLYIGGIAFAALPSYKKHKNNSNYISVGASGAVSAIVFSSVIFEPLNKIYLFAILPMPAIVFALMYLGYEYYASKRSNDGINHDAHFWGALFGAIFTTIIKPELFLIFVQKLFY